jgi:crotonobetainyl-CoA:carnitine CoA-transferase CaiB-like acyl-CoA transferase
MMEKALQGIKILDFTHLLQGPFATQMLGDFGAEIIKVEKPGSGDFMRSLRLLNTFIGDETTGYMSFNRNKRSLALNLKNSKATEIIHQLARECDVIVENFRPGVMDKLGIGYEDLKLLNPGIIYCSSTGYGSDGPYSNRPGQDLLVQSLTGLVMMSGRADYPPIPLGTSIADQVGAYHIVQAILMALIYKGRTGKGQKIEVNLYQSLLAHQIDNFVTVLNSGRQFERPKSGIAHPGVQAPFGIYETQDHKWLAIAMNPIEKLAEVLEYSRLIDYNQPEILFNKRDEIYEEIQSVIIKKTRDVWIDSMLAKDLWVAEVKSYAEVIDDPQAKHLEAFTTIKHPKAEFKTVNIPIKMSESPGGIDRYPPMLGEHTEEILIELGYSHSDIKSMGMNGVF